MSTYQIPDDHLNGFALLSKLPKDKIAKLIKALKESTIGLFPTKLTKEIAVKTGINRYDVDKIISVLFSLYGLKLKDNKNTLELVDDISESLGNIQSFKISPEALKNFKQNLNELLSLDKSIGMTVKTLSLGSEYEKLFINSRIITDIRPAFENLNGNVNTAIIAHNFKIEYHTGHRHEEVYVSLSSNDLIELKEQIIRAEKKEEIIRKSLGKTLQFISATDKK